MEILKSLNLNRNPKDLKSGSLVCAKNMVVDYSSSYLTNEPGFAVGFECPNEGEFIVGCITCISEIVIFTWNRNTKESKIYRKPDNEEAREVTTGWKYSGGKLVGSFTYNYKKELIIGLGEYDALDLAGNKVQVPFKCWNLDNNNVSNSYNIEDIIPRFKVNRFVNNEGHLVCGVYTFFIRFKVDDASYTKWFQLTDDIYIIDSIAKEKPNHKFLTSDNTDTASANTDGFVNLYYNSNSVSDKAISIYIEYLESTNYEQYQIGYIIRHNSDIKGRIYSEFSIDETTINIGNNEYNEEIEVDEFLKSPHQFYDVKNVITYNNRLYISNYSEYKNEDLQLYADKCEITLKAIEEDVEETRNYETTNVTLQTSIYNGSNITLTVNKISTYTVERDGETITYITNPKKFIKDFASKINLIPNNNGRIDNIATGYEAYYNPPIDQGDGTKLQYEKASYRLAFWDDRRGSYITLYHSDVSLNDLVDYKLRIADGILYIELDDYVREFDSSNNTEGNIVGLAIECHVKVVLFSEYGQRIEDEGYIWINDPRGMTPYPTKPSGVFRVFSTSAVLQNTIVFDAEVNKSLVPGQVYAFYIHYIRKDKSYTNGYPLTNKALWGESATYDNAEYSASNGVKQNGQTIPSYRFVPYTTEDGRRLFMCPNSTDNTKPCIRLRITTAIIPKGYIGYFISYEKLENLAVPVVPIAKIQDESIYRVHVTNTDFIYSEGQIVGKYWFNSFSWLRLTKIDDNNKGILDNNNNKIIKLSKYKKLLTTPYTELLSDGTNNINVDTPINIITHNPNIYNKKDKTLYRITDDIFRLADAQDANYMYDSYIPGFYTKEKIVTYDTEIIINPTASNVLDGDGENIDGYTIATTHIDILDNENNVVDTKAISYYAHKLYDAYSILQDYNVGSVSLINHEGQAKGVAYNKVLSPDRLPSFLDIKEAYTSSPVKSYTNYSKNNIDHFDKTIYRSNVVSDESLVNGFREFEIDNYKNIFENKGNIINIVGIGLYFIVHTEYSIFVFDRSPKLSNKAQLDIPDVFDISYQELLPSSEGFGGISSKEESIISKHGYIWFDKRNRIIFKYENGQIEVISQNIFNLIKSLDIDTVRFAEDIERNRLLICFYLNEYDENGYQVTLTISYNFVTKEYISLHDYSFTHNFKTSSVSYIFDENKDRCRLYVYNTQSIGFKNIWSSGNKYYDSYITELLFGDNVFNVVNRIKMDNVENYHPLFTAARSLYASRRQYDVDVQATRNRGRRAGRLEESPQIIILNNGTFTFTNIDETFRVTYTTDGSTPSNNNGKLFRIIDHDTNDLVLHAERGTVINYGKYIYADAPTDIVDIQTKTILDENDYDGTAPSLTPFKYTDGSGYLRVGVTIEQNSLFGTTYYTLDGSDPTENSNKVNSFFADYDNQNQNWRWGSNWCYSKSKAVTYRENIVIKAITIYGNKRSQIVTYNTASENPYPTLIAPQIQENGKILTIINKNNATPLLNDGPSTYGTIKYILNGDETTEYDYSNEISLEHTRTTWRPIIESITAWIVQGSSTSERVTFEPTVRDIFVDVISSTITERSSTRVEIQLRSQLLEWSLKDNEQCKLYYTTDGSEPQLQYDEQSHLELVGTTEEYDSAEGIVLTSETSVPLTIITIKLMYANNGKIWYSNTSTVAYLPTEDEYEDITEEDEDIYVPETKGEGAIASNKIYKSYVDIIITGEYDIPKVLDSISYTLSELQYYYFKNNPAEEDLIKAFSGDFIRIYSDSVDTGILSIATKGNINEVNDYQHPYYEKGKWNLNYFRDMITTPITNTRRQTVPVFNIIQEDSEFILDRDVTDISGNPNIVFSDERSLVYGKYFVIRFIFNNDKKVKLENIDVNIQKY